MGGSRGLLLIACISLLTTGSHAVDIEGVVDILKLGWEMSKTLAKTWRIIDENAPDDGILHPSYFDKQENRLLTEMTEISTRLKHVESLVHTSTITVTTMLRDLSFRVRLEIMLHELAGCVSRVDYQHKQLLRYLNQGYDNETDTWHIERHTLENFAEVMVSHSDDSVRSRLHRMHDMIASTTRSGPLAEGLFSKLADSVKDSDNIPCTLMQSPQQMLFNLYNTVALSELKGYTMMQFSWMLLRLYDKGNFTSEAELMRNSFQERTLQKLDAARKAMKHASRQMWRCDPKVHFEGKTYVKLTRLLQGHLQNEVDMNHDNSCRDNCNYYSFAQSTSCFDQRICNKLERCKGRLHDCQYIDSDMWVCQANPVTGRRYEWIEYENGRTLGNSNTCQNGRMKVDSWWRWVFWHCSYCFCLCDEQGPFSDRYFNLRPVLADTANNKVVTGLRFVKNNRIVHLQIQEGTLLPRGGINESTLQWRPIDDYRISDTDVQNGIDFHTLSWEQRAIDLDDLEAPPGHVLTGIRFRSVGTHLNPEIMVTPINFTEGTLVKPKDKSTWISNDNTDASYDKPRTQLHLTAPDVPTNSHVGSLPDSVSDQYMLFTHSDINKDAAQTTLPYIDAQDVTHNPPVPLSGAGIYHKGTPGYGGFIAPRIMTFDFSTHMTAEFPTKN